MCQSGDVPYTKLRAELDRLSSGIWDDVTLVRQLGAPWRLGEVTVTERLHLDLLRAGHLNKLVVYNVPDEKATGADWEWLVQVPGTSTYLKYRVQAKILESGGNNRRTTPLRFGHLDHPKGTATQRRTLITRAKADGMIPLYAFFVGDPWPSKEAVALPPAWAVSLGISKEEFGCTVVPAGLVSKVHAHVPSRTSKLAANQYLSENQGSQSWRLSDLFPGGASFGGPSGSNGGGIGGVRPTELTPQEKSLLEVFSGAGQAPVILRDLPPEEAELETGQLRMTAFFTA